MRNIIAGLAMLVSTAVAAEPITLHIFTGPGGFSAVAGQILADGLNKRGYTVDFRALGNCALAKTTWDNAKGPVLGYRDSLINNDVIANCDTPTTKDNLVLHANDSAGYFCNTGPNGASLDDFDRKGSVHAVGTAVTYPEVAMFQQISKDVGNTVKVLQYKLQSEVAAAAKSGEINFILANGPWPETQLGAKCFWTTGLNSIPGYARAVDLWPNNIIVKATYGAWYIAKGFTPEQMAKLRKDAADIWNEQEWTELRRKRGWDDAHVTQGADASMQTIDTTRSIWNQFKR
jgi:hypothetical protein